MTRSATARIQIQYQQSQGKRKVAEMERLTKIEERLEKLDNTIRETTEKQRIVRAELNQKVQGFTEE